MANCKKCEKPFPDGSKFCPGCGVAINFKCNQCQEMLDPSYTFCPNCGKRVTDSSTVVTAPRVINTPRSEVFFGNKALEEIIRQKLDKPDGILTDDDLENLTELDLTGTGIGDISGLEVLTNLTHLTLKLNDINDIKQLGSLTSLTNLNLTGNQTRGPLQSRTNWADTGLNNDQIDDINQGLTSLTSLTNLTSLKLEGIGITDIFNLVSLTNLTDLNLTDNQIGDIAAIGYMTSLTNVDLKYNQLRDLGSIRVLKSLGRLDLSNNQISDISGLESVTNLRYLDLSYNQISDISGLGSLTSLRRIDLSNNQISDISVLGSLAKLGTIWVDCKINQLKTNKQISPHSFTLGLLQVGLAPICEEHRLEYETDLQKLPLEASPMKIRELGWDMPPGPEKIRDLVKFIDNEKYEDIVCERFGIAGDFDKEPETFLAVNSLEKVGNVFGITRERVRQILKKSQKLVSTAIETQGESRDNPTKYPYHPSFYLWEQFRSQYSVEAIFGLSAPETYWDEAASEQERSLIVDDIAYAHINLWYWAIGMKPMEQPDETGIQIPMVVRNKATTFFKEVMKESVAERSVNVVSKQSYLESLNGRNLSPETAEFYWDNVELYHHIRYGDNILRMDYISLAYVVLEEENAELHWEQIFERANKLIIDYGNGKKLTKTSMYNAINQWSNIFAYRGPGTYALSDLGFDPVPFHWQTIVEILKEAEDPLTFSEIAERIRLKGLTIKDTSLIVYLSGASKGSIDNYVESIGDGKYRLKSLK